MKSRLLVLPTIVLLAATMPFAQQRTRPEGRASTDEKAERAAVGELVALLSLPNVATDQADIHRNAEYLRQAFERRGFQMEVVETSHSPVVLGELRAPGSTRSLTFYAHYDGQPVVPSEWKDAPPFQPIFRTGSIEQGGNVVSLPDSGPLNRNWRVYARSSSDDKGAIAALLAALDQVRASGGAVTSTIRVVLEGDEEAGSPVLEEVVMARARPEARGTAGLQTGGDLVIMMDGPRHASGRSTFFFGARGIVSAEIAVFGAKHDLHSGNYGNWAPNPALELARLLASMKDDGGKVTIAGFYDDVVPLTAEETRAIAEIPEVEQDQMRAFGFARPESAGQGSSPAGPRLEERHNLPAFNVSGLGSGTVAGQGRTIIPSVAVARIDMRLVKAIEPAKQMARLRAHIERQGYHLIAGEQPTDEDRARYPKLARLTQFEGYPAGRTSIDQPTARAVVAAVAAAPGAGVPIRYPTLGGSAPFYVFTDRLRVPTIGMPIANYDNNQHGPNENLQFGAFFDGIAAIAAILRLR
jgi:acetylornithine deacetylase/succinyl-diaminopimelate desuccinylase-like protein